MIPARNNNIFGGIWVSRVLTGEMMIFIETPPPDEVLIGIIIYCSEMCIDREALIICLGVNPVDSLQLVLKNTRIRGEGKVLAIASQEKKSLR